MQRNDQPKNQRDFFHVLKIFHCIGLGILAALLYSMKDIVRDPTLVFSVGTVVAFIAVAIAGWFLWSFVEESAKERP